MANSIAPKPHDGFNAFIRALPFHKISGRQAFVLAGGVLLFFVFLATLTVKFGEATNSVRVGEIVVIFFYMIWGVATNLS